MTPISRTDQAHDLGYPTSADSRGSARVYHMRRPYYLGPYESPQSYVMFGLWKQRLLETNEPCETKDLRPIVDNILSNSDKPVDSVRRKVIPRVVLALTCATTLMMIGVAIGRKIPSTIAPALVDGINLTQDETQIIRGVRKNDRNLARASQHPARFIQIMEELKAEGPEHGRWHIEQKDL